MRKYGSVITIMNLKTENVRALLMECDGEVESEIIESLGPDEIFWSNAIEDACKNPMCEEDEES